MNSSLDGVCAQLYETVSNKAEAVIQNVATVVVAPERVIRLGVASLLAGGHLLLNDLPGVGKTLLAKSIALSIGAPEKSQPGIIGRGNLWPATPRRTQMSRWFIALARTRTRASFCRIDGGSAFSSLKTSGPPCS